MRAYKFAFVLVAGLILAGCEWEGTGSDNYWSKDMAFNVSGTYREENGSYLVRKPGLAGQLPQKDIIGYGDGINAVFSGTTSKKPVVSSSLLATDGTETFSANPKNPSQLISDGSPSGVGNIAYDRGVVSLSFGKAPVTNVAISVSYLYFDVGSPENPQIGNSGDAIFQMSVIQNGDRLEILDDQGQKFIGRISDPYENYSFDYPATSFFALRAEAINQNKDVSGNMMRQIGLSYPFVVDGVAESSVTPNKTVKVTITGTFKSDVIIMYSQATQGGNNTALEELYRRTTWRVDATWVEEETGRTAVLKGTGPSDLQHQVIPPVMTIQELLLASGLITPEELGYGTNNQ